MWLFKPRMLREASESNRVISGTPATLTNGRTALAEWTLSTSTPGGNRVGHLVEFVLGEILYLNGFRVWKPTKASLNLIKLFAYLHAYWNSSTLLFLTGLLELAIPKVENCTLHFVLNLKQFIWVRHILWQWFFYILVF